MVLLSPPPLIASVNADPEEAKNLAEGRILRLIQIRFDYAGPHLTRLLDLSRTDLLNLSCGGELQNRRRDRRVRA